jgi:hypothetical protein
VSVEKPNGFRFHHGEDGSHGRFCDSCCVSLTLITKGAGHKPHFSASFEGGLELDLTPAALRTFVQKAQAELRKLPVSVEDIHDYTGEE